MYHGTLHFILFQFSYLIQLIRIACISQGSLLCIDLMFSKPSLPSPTHCWLHRSVRVCTSVTWTLLLRFFRMKRQIKTFNHLQQEKEGSAGRGVKKKGLENTHSEVTARIFLLGIKSQFYRPVHLRHVWYGNFRSISWRSLNLLFLS